jgi:putative tricarboxylic transport membrane protein
VTSRTARGFYAAAIAAVVVWMPERCAVAQYYQGKTLNVVVGAGAGGSLDTFARYFLNIWTKHIPGNPNTVVQNMPGAGTLRAQNYVYEIAKPDGLTIYFGSWDPVAQALNLSALRARYDKVAFIGGTGEVRVTYGRSDLLPSGARITRPEQIAGLKDPIWMGGMTRTAIPTILNRLSLDVLGVKHKFVGGFSGGEAIRLAMLRNEIQVFQSAISTFRRGNDLVSSGDWIGLYYLLPVKEDGSYTLNKYIDDVPALPELYRKIHGNMPSGPQWNVLNWLTDLVGDMFHVTYAPPGTPTEALDALRSSYAKVMVDPEFVEPAMKRNRIPYSFISVQEGERVLRTLGNTDPSIRQELSKIMEEQ